MTITLGSRSRDLASPHVHPLVLPSHRESLILVLRPMAIVAALLVLYALTPVNAGPAAVAAVLSSLASVGLLLWIVVRQTRRIARHAEPAVAAVEALTLLGALFVLSFSMTYVALSASDLALSANRSTRSRRPTSR